MDYSLTDDWGGGFSAEISLTNLSDEVWPGWELSFLTSPAVHVVDASGANVQNLSVLTKLISAEGEAPVNPGESIRTEINVLSAYGRTHPIAFMLNQKLCRASSRRQSGPVGVSQDIESAGGTVRGTVVEVQGGIVRFEVEGAPWADVSYRTPNGSGASRMLADDSVNFYRVHGLRPGSLLEYQFVVGHVEAPGQTTTPWLSYIYTGLDAEVASPSTPRVSETAGGGLRFSIQGAPWAQVQIQSSDQSTTGVLSGSGTELAFELVGLVRGDLIQYRWVIGTEQLSGQYHTDWAEYVYGGIPAIDTPWDEMAPTDPGIPPSSESDSGSDADSDPIPGVDSTRDGWNLIWADEFEGIAGDSPDSARWVAEVGGGGWGNSEHQYYSDRTENAALDGSGNLVITAAEVTQAGESCWYGECLYTSARLVTEARFEQQYGRIEARLKLPFGQGIWPAFWMLGNDFRQVGWPQCGEIDIMENIGSQPSTVHGTIHGPGYSGSEGLTGSFSLADGERFSDDFHIFAIEWQPDAIRWFVDEKVIHTLTPSSVSAGNWVFDHPFFLLLNVAVGGQWPGYPDETTVFPQHMRVDYVRVYERDEMGSGSPVRDVSDRIQVEEFDTAEGLLIERTEDQGGGENVGWIADGDYGRYAGIDFGDVAPALIELRMASGSDVSGWLEVRIDSLDGPEMARIPMQNTGGWQVWSTVEVETLLAVTGVHDLYLSFRSDFGVTEFGNVNWIRFKNNVESNTDESVSETDAQGDAQTQVDIDGEVFTYVVIPDTQFMTIWHSGSLPEMFQRQTDWIAESADDLNILFVSHLGDIVEFGGSHDQWEIADRAMSTLDEVVPYGMTFGNHDADDRVWGRLDENFNRYFPPERYAAQSWYGGGYPFDKNTNSYQFFESADVEYMVVHLQWNPPSDVLAWVDQLLGLYPEKRTIVSTHEFPGNWDLWDQVLRHHAQVFLVVSGHECARERADVLTNDLGGQVHAILTDYQCDNPASAFLRYYTFLPSGFVEARTYSPWTNEFEEDSDSFFSFVPEFSPGESACEDAGPTPYGGSAVILPGRIEAESYDSGCNGVAFWDTDLPNRGGAFRTDPVDIEIAEDAGGGYDVGWLRDGEWLGYTIEVPEAGRYTIDFRIASDGDGSSFRIEIDGSGVGEDVAVPSTGGWQNWQTVSLSAVDLPAGTHVLRVVILDGDFNLNYIEVH